MESDKKYIRFINFDLSNDLLKQYYPRKNIKQAWDDIKDYLIDNNFVHRQRSCYMSKEPLTVTNLILITDDMFKQMPWILQCANKFDATVIAETFDLLNGYILRNTVSIDLLKENPPEKNQEDFSFKQGSEKSKKTNMITQPVRTEVTLEQATKMAQAGIPFQIMHGDNQKVMAVFDKSDIDKVKQIKNPSSKQTRGR